MASINVDVHRLPEKLVDGKQLTNLDNDLGELIVVEYKMSLAWGWRPSDFAGQQVANLASGTERATLYDNQPKIWNGGQQKMPLASLCCGRCHRSLRPIPDPSPNAREVKTGGRSGWPNGVRWNGPWMVWSMLEV